MKSNTSNQSLFDALLILLIFAVSLIVRLWNIQAPESTIFEEYRFGQYLNCYCNGSFFFDTAPPLGKLVLFEISKMFKYQCNYDFQSSMPKRSQTANFIPIRYGVCFIASLAPSLIFIVLRRSSVSWLSACTSAGLMIFDMSMVTESRYIIPDGILLTLVALHLLALSYDFGNYTPFVCGFTLGLCISTKFTTLPLILFSVFVLVKKMNVKGILVMIVTAFVILDLITVLHMSLLPEPTDDVDEFLPVTLQQHMFVERDPGHFPIDAISLNLRMMRIAMGNKRFHPYQSTPLSWPLLTGIWVSFWDNMKGREIVLMGNPVVYYIGFMSVIMLLSVFWRMNRNVANSAAFGWCLSYFPFLLSTSTLFLYHYQIPLLFAIMSFAPMFDRMIHVQIKRYTICVAIVFLAMIAFLYWSPLVYGTYVPNLKRKIWFTTWAKGSKRHRQLVEEFFGLDF